MAPWSTAPALRECAPTSRSRTARSRKSGKSPNRRKRTIDASDLIVAPGFIDPHTHYDAQICWDPLVTCTSWHGVTSVVMGNCGVGIAPCKPEVREIAAWDLVNVEAIPFDALKRGITWDWDNVSAVHGRGAKARQRNQSRIHGAAHAVSPFRDGRGIDGARGNARGDREDRRRFIKEAVAAGAFGWSTTTLPQHIGFQGRPLACRLASRDELKAYAGALRDLGKGAIEVALTRRAGRVSEEEEDLLGFLLNESDAASDMARHVESAEASGSQRGHDAPARAAIRRGGVPQVLPKPFVVQMDLRNPFTFADTESWNPIFNQPPEKQKEIYRDKGWRNRWREEMKKPRLFAGKWHRVEVLEVTNPAMKGLERKTVAEIAEERGADPLDTYIDLALEDDLQIQYTMAQFDESGIERLIKDDRTRGRAFRRRRAREHAVRRGILHLPARALGAREGGAHTGAGRQAADDGAGGFLRHQGSWSTEERPRRRCGDLRSSEGRVGTTCADARRSARRRTAPGDAVAGHRIHNRQWSVAIRTRQAFGRDAGNCTSFGEELTLREILVKE